MSREHDPLWDAYADAEGEDRRALAGRIVEGIIPWITRYASDTAFPQWSDELREDYRQDLILMALERVEQYRPGTVGRSGRAVTFPGYLAVVFQDQRWRVAGDASLIRVGKTTLRAKAAMEQLERAHEAKHGRKPTDEELSVELTHALRRAHSVETVKRLRAIAGAQRANHLTRGVATHQGDADGAHVAESIRDQQHSPEDLAIEHDERARLRAAVADAMDCLSPRDQQIAWRMLADEGEGDGLTPAEYAQLLDITPRELAQATARVRGFLAMALAHLAS